MNEGIISKRYAKALIEYAREQKSEDEVFSEMKKIISVYASEPMLRMAMDNPTLDLKEKLEVIKVVLGHAMSDTLTRFISLILSHNREKQLKNIALCYSDLYCEEKQINVGQLITASPVDSKTEEKMKSLLTKIKSGGTLNFETKVDPSIKGGFILFIDSYRLDASVATQLNRIRKQFIIENSKMQ